MFRKFKKNIFPKFTLKLTVVEITTIYNQIYFAGNVAKQKSSIDALMHIKNDFKCPKNLKIYSFG